MGGVSDRSWPWAVLGEAWHLQSHRLGLKELLYCFLAGDTGSHCWPLEPQFPVCEKEIVKTISQIAMKTWKTTAF